MADVVTSTNLTKADAPLWNTEAHHGPAISVVTWFFIVAVVLAVAARTVTRFAITRKLRWDDKLVLLALVVAIGQCIAVSAASTIGLGSHADTLTADKIESIQKALYAHLLLYITTLGLIKVSVCIHVYSLSPVKSTRQTSIALAAIVGVWAVTGLFVVAFQCKIPEPWSLVQGPGKCIDLLAFWTYFGILNIITDLALIALPVPIFVKLQVRTSQKAVIMACYSTRLAVVVAQILQIYYFQLMSTNAKKSPGSVDLFYDLWIPTLVGQIVLTTSIIASCFPFLKFLIDSLETGMVRADGLNTTHKQLRLGPSHGGGSSNGYFRAQGSQFKKGPENTATELDEHKVTSPTSPRWGGRSKSHGDKNTFRMQSLDGNGGATSKRGNETGGGYQQRNDGNFESMAYRGDDGESQSSQTHIMRKVEWSLTEETAPERAV